MKYWILIGVLASAMALAGCGKDSAGELPPPAKAPSEEELKQMPPEARDRYARPSSPGANAPAPSSGGN